MNAVKYVEVNARDFLTHFCVLMQNESIMEDVLNDEHYIFRLSPNAIELCYPEDKALAPHNG